MQKMGTILEFKTRSSTHRDPGASRGAGAVVDMTEKREERLAHEQRAVKRTILSQFVGASVVVPSRGLERVVLYDISEGGIGFDMDDQFGHFRAGDEVAMRVYLNHSTYFPFFVRIANVRHVGEDRVYRHGGGFVEGTINNEALHHFVKFIETVSAALKTDQGDVMVSSLR
jgi:hypothetical protein